LRAPLALGYLGFVKDNRTTERALAIGFLVLAAIGVVTLFGDTLRALGGP
jgi:hypothetical protein